MATTLHKIWYVSPTKFAKGFKSHISDDVGDPSIARRFKWFIFDDIGSMQLQANKLLFRGTRYRFECVNPIYIRFVRQPFPWLTVFFGVAPVLLATSLAVFGFFTWQIPLAAAALFFVGLSILCVVTWAHQWIEVSFANEKAEQQTAFFMDGSVLMGSQMFGATRRLFRLINDVVIHGKKAKGS